MPDPQKGREKFAMDPFGLASAAGVRWDFSTVLPTLQEELAYRADAARKRTERLAKALAEFTAAVERRQKNAETAAAITYVMARAQVGAPGFAGPDLTFAHLAAARATLRQDAGVAKTAMQNYDPLREGLNASIERSRELDRASAKGQPPADDKPPGPPSITIANADLAQARTQRMLKERVPPLEALKAALAAEAFARELQQRETWNSLAPPPPTPEMEYRPYVDPNTPMPELTEPDRIRVPEDPRQPPPEPRGLELTARAVGAEVVAAAAGEVVHAGPFRGYGNVVIVQHEKDLFSVYGYLEKLELSNGQKVKAGQGVGSAGMLPRANVPGIFFDVRRGAQSVAPAALIAGDPRAVVLR